MPVIKRRILARVRAACYTVSIGRPNSSPLTVARFHAIVPAVL